VFINKSGADERTGKRRNGWAPTGCPIIVKELLKHMLR
jgi:hypothetical protein